MSGRDQGPAAVAGGAARPTDAVMLESLLVVLACMLVVMLELLVVLAILAPEAIVRALRRLGPRHHVRRG